MRLDTEDLNKMETNDQMETYTLDLLSLSMFLSL